ncbi:hypothetical protein [Streptomyces sp. NPDC005017]|uniref:hypothetical protein n=1 Tax=Streptomyces sp. NPDC005017 TaxID=3364706 RepID=UPI00369C3F21
MAPTAAGAPAGLVAAFLAVKAGRRSLEDVARPLTAAKERVRQPGRERRMA